MEPMLEQRLNTLEQSRQRLDRENRCRRRLVGVLVGHLSREWVFDVLGQWRHGVQVTH